MGPPYSRYFNKDGFTGVSGFLALCQQNTMSAPSPSSWGLEETHKRALDPTQMARGSCFLSLPVITSPLGRAVQRQGGFYPESCLSLWKPQSPLCQCAEWALLKFCPWHIKESPHLEAALCHPQHQRQLETAPGCLFSSCLPWM